MWAKIVKKGNEIAQKKMEKTFRISTEYQTYMTQK
jgi:hypothetical protein